MTYETKAISLKNGKNAVIVQPDPDRAEEMLDFLRDISSETEFISRTAEEVWETVEIERQKLEDLVNVVTFRNCNFNFRFCSRFGSHVREQRTVVHFGV